MNLEKILKEKAMLIDKEIEKVFPKKGLPNLYDAVWYTLPGGKRVRPILAIVTCETLGGDTKKVLPFAAACEIFHNWLLVHDDIMDHDVIRRDKKAVWVKYGLAHGVNIGDFLSQKVFELILNSKKYGVDDRTIMKLMESMIETAVKTAEGQTMDINMRNKEPKEKEYMEMIIKKTAYYMTVPMIGGSIISKADKEIIKKIKKFGIYAGPAFQIADDLLDLTEGKGRGEIGRDIKEGKKSILVIHCLRKCSKKEKQRLLKILNKPADETSKKEVLWVKRLFEKYGSVDYARNKAENLIKKAKYSIRGTPSRMKEILEIFANYLVYRKK